MGMVWSADKKEPTSWLLSISAFVLPHLHRFRWLPRGASSSTSTSRRRSSLATVRRRQAEWRSRLAYVCPDQSPFGAAWMMLALMTRAMPVSLLRQAGRSELPCSDRFDARQVGAETGDVVQPICSLLLCRQLGQATGRASRKRWLFPGE